MKKYRKIIIATLTLITLSGCMGGKKITPVAEMSAGEIDAPQPFIFAETDVLNVDSDMLADKFRTGQPAGQIRTIDSAMALDAVYQILLDSILGQDAATYDLAAERPSMYRQYLDLRRDRVMRMMFTEVIVDSVSVSDSAVRARFEDRKEEFWIPDQYRARHIVIAGEGFKYTADSAEYAGKSDEELDSLARQKMLDIRLRLLNGESFDTLAMLYSQDSNSARRGGDLGYFELKQMVSPFDSTVEHTPIGTVSGIIKTQYGWHVVLVEDFSPGHYLDVDSVYTDVEKQVMGEAIRARSRTYLDSLRAEMHLVFDTAALMIDDSLYEDSDALAYVNPDDIVFGNDTVYYSDYRKFVFSFKKARGISDDLNFDQKIELISEMAVRDALIQASRKLGYYNHPEIEQWAEMTIKKYSISAMRQPHMNDDYEPTEEELRAYYENHLDEYVVERPITLQHIVFADSNLAEHVRDQLMAGADFMEMVDQYYPGDPDIRRVAADLGAIGPDDMPSEFYAMARRTAVNDISHPVKTVFGYHLIKVLSKTESRAFEQTRPQIRPILKRIHRDQKIRNYVDSRLGRPPLIHWEYLDKLYRTRVTRPDFSTFPSIP